VPEVFDHPQTIARDMILESQHASAGTVKLVGFPYKLSNTPAEVQRASPLLGEHTDEVLSSLLNYSNDDVKTLREKKAI
jgi:crotonobetainyl-CoA:carnitine CoA-transferase CaiB-like acyl-CoA transferase